MEICANNSIDYTEEPLIGFVCWFMIYGKKVESKIFYGKMCEDRIEKNNNDMFGFV